MNRPSRQLATFHRRLTGLRDREIRRFIGQANDWSKDVEREVLGGVAGARTVDEAVDRLGPIGKRAIERIERETMEFLRGLYRWTWTQGIDALVDAVPMAAWLVRHLPATVGAGESVGYDLWERDADGGEVDPRIQRILDGKASDEEAKQTVRDLEFGTPTKQQVEQTVNDRAWPDGLTVTERIKTVQAEQLADLADLIRGKMRGGFTGASAIKALAKPIRALVGNDPGESTGMNYRAQRIARTEGVRVAQDALHESWESAADMFEGIRTFTAGDANVRQEHRPWHDKLFRRRSDGGYVADDGESLPRFPAGPNCRCWDTPELLDEITSGAPERNLGAYVGAKARAAGRSE